METMLDGKYRKPTGKEAGLGAGVLLVFGLLYGFTLGEVVIGGAFAAVFGFWSAYRLPEIGPGEEFEDARIVTHVLTASTDADGRVIVGYRYFLYALSPLLNLLFGVVSYGTLYKTNRRLIFSRQRIWFNGGRSFSIGLDGIREVHEPRFVGSRLDVQDYVTRLSGGRLDKDDAAALVDLGSLLSGGASSALTVANSVPQVLVMFMKVTRNGFVVLAGDEGVHFFMLQSPAWLRERLLGLASGSVPAAVRMA